MTRLSVNVFTEDPRLEVAPVLLTFRDSQRTGIAAPRMPFLSASGISGTADLLVPGYKRRSMPFELNEGSSMTIDIDESDLEAEATDECPPPSAVRVTEGPWTAPDWYSSGKQRYGGPITQKNIVRQITITAAGPSSSVAIVPVGTGSTFLKVSYDVDDQMYRVMPVDTRVALLLYYLQNGDYLLAGAVARSLELQNLLTNPDRHDGATLLAIGYGHAFAGNYHRLRAWNRREGEYITGADGLILKAECAKSCNKHDEAASILAQLAGQPPPSFTCGLELGVRRLIGYQRTPSHERLEKPAIKDYAEKLGQLHAGWQETLLRSNPDSVFVTLPVDPDLALQPTVEPRRRAVFRHFMNWLRASPPWARLRGTPLEPIRVKEDIVVSNQTSQTSAKQLGRTALVVAVAAVVLWAVVSVILITQKNVNDVAWARLAWVFGSIEAIAFAAAGALFGTAITRGQAEKAEERAGQAEERAESLNSAAASGRALGASLQAEEAAKFGPPDETGQSMSVTESAEDEAIRRHARLSRALLGDLV